MSYPAFQKVGKKLLPPALLQHATESANTRNKLFQILLEQRKWPEIPWDDPTIEIFLHELSSMDTNNFSSKPSGLGEREGRVYSSLVKRRSYGLTHGVGRSGDLAESQPKAAGSSLISSLTNDLLLDFLQSNIGKDVKEACLFPMATGMTMTLILLTLKKLKPEAKYVLWLRHDQKSVFKSILTADLTPVIIDPIEDQGSSDQLCTNLDGIENQINLIGRPNILCIITTTSCFAPRACDDLKSLRKFRFGSRVTHDICESTKCSRHFSGTSDTCGSDVIYHVVNNAYGMQSQLILNVMRKAMSHVDLFIQSTDKNLLVPVGGCILGSPLSGKGGEPSLLTLVRKNYPGRASSYPVTDVLITILSMGKQGWRELMEVRVENYKYLKGKLKKVVEKHGERVLGVEDNDISIGVSLKSVGDGVELTSIGAMLFKRNVTGARVVSTEDIKNIEGFTFKGTLKGTFY